MTISTEPNTTTSEPRPDTDQVAIFDTTLRDGEQSPGIALDEREKLEIAIQLARLGVDVIEAGFPAASPGDFASVEAIARVVREPIIAGLSRTSFADIDRAEAALRDAERARLHVFIATSQIHMDKKLHMTRPQVLAEAVAAVSRARGFCDDVEFSPEDALRSERDFVVEVCQAAVGAGATTLNIPDTVGFALPSTYSQLIAYVIEHVTGDFIVSTHCHDDLGLAVANSLAGVAAGARQIECAINGLGERAGNAALEEVAVTLAVHADEFPGRYRNLYTNINTQELARTSQLVSRLTGYLVQRNKAIVGRNAFAHEAGIHQHGVLSDKATYEAIDAASVGREPAEIYLGKHSGRHAVSNALTAMGLQVSGAALDQVFRRFKVLADRKTELQEADLEAIVAEELGTTATQRFTLEAVSFEGGSDREPFATAEVTVDGVAVTVTATGDGMIDAAFNALSQATSSHASVVEFNVAAVTPGSDALGDVTLRLAADGHHVIGRGVATDVSEAAARAYVAGLNKLARLA